MKEFFQKVPRSVYILTAIVLVGIFLRVYHFHAFLDFENDQVRDANLVRNVLEGKRPWPLLGPDMTGSGRSHNSGLFYVGPAYYYFEIISSQLFGDNPVAQAYPNLLLAILSIPLFYFFLKRYFHENLSLALTALYAISYYAILYARFTWNSNPIPFFVLLFLLTLHEFLVKKEKTHWLWAVLLGVAVGIGFQLHLILMALFPATAFFVFLYLFIKNKKIWKPLVLAVLIAIVLNVPQIIHEVEYNYSNTRTFIKDMTVGERMKTSKKTGVFTDLEKSVDCNIESNTFMATSAGMNVCDFSYLILMHHDNPAVMNVLYANTLSNINSGMFLAESARSSFWVMVVGGLIFSLLGYGLFASQMFREKDEGRRCFLYLTFLYLVLSFFIMTEVLGGGFVEFRYFIHTFFVPFLLLGFMVEYLLSIKKFWLVWIGISVLLFLGVAAFNVKAIADRYRVLANKDGSSQHFVILGEVEPMLRYFMQNAGGERQVELDGNPRYLSNFFNALNYLAGNRNFRLIRIDRPYKITPGQSLFYITANAPNPANMKEDGHWIKDRQNFGQVTIYQLANP